MSQLNSQSLFAEMQASNKYGILHKEHKVVEYDVWVGEERHLLPKDIEDEMYALGFTQRKIKRIDLISPIEGINQLEFTQYLGVFDHERFEVTFNFEKKGIWRMLIFPPNSQLTIDDGRYYNSKTGIPRLTELLGSN